MDNNVILDQENDCFKVVVEGLPSVLEFRKKSENCWEYFRTFVPPELRHRGIASQLVRYALDYALEHSIKVIPSCGFVKEFIEEHNEYQIIVDRT